MASTVPDDIYDLTPLQEGILFHSLYEGGNGMYIVQTTRTMQGALDVEIIETAWKKVFASNPMLRTAFEVGEFDRPLQIVFSKVDLPIQFMDWRAESTGDQRVLLNDLLANDRAQGFDISVAPLVRIYLARISDTSHTLIWSSHHILLDGWSLELIFEQFLREYRALNSSDNLNEPVRTLPFSTYFQWLQKRDTDKAEMYWRDELSNYRPTLLADRHPDQSGHEDQSVGRKTIALSAETTDCLKKISRKYHLTLNTIVRGAWALTLSK